jgi:hypothetical protein
MRLACGFAILLWLSFPAAGMASRQQSPADDVKAAEQAPATPAPQENTPAESAPVQKSPPETAPAKTAPAEQVPPETTPAAPANPTTPAAEKKAPDNEAKPKIDASSADGTSARGTSPTGASSNGTRKRRKHSAPAPDGAPRKIVVREGGAKEPAAQIAPGMTPVEATRQRQNAEQLLASADDRLKQLAGRTLDTRQQETVAQVRNYMGGARSALKEGDVRRANTLAQKAHLLAEDLVKHYGP